MARLDGPAVPGTVPRIIDRPDRDFEDVACALCGSDEAVPVMTSKNWDPQDATDAWYRVVQCRGCGLQFLNPRPRPESLKRFYPEHYYAYQNTDPTPIGRYKEFWESVGRWSKAGLRRAFWRYPPAGGRIERAALRTLLWPLWLRTVLLGKDLKVFPYHGRGRLLEVGCGTGSGLDYQRQYGFTVAGCEMSRAAVDVAHTRYRLDVRLGTLEEAQFPARSFDLISMSHVFEHLPSPSTTLDEMHRVLDTDGLAILKLPNIASASARRFGAYWLGLDLPRHLYHFSPETVTALLHRHGFAVTSVRQDVGSWGFWRESRRLLTQHLQHRDPSFPWWQDRLDQAREVLACWRGQGSNMVVSARKVTPAPRG